MELHQGRISVVSPDSGGTVATISVPASQAD
jgi:signal transduction histidine kinase